MGWWIVGIAIGLGVVGFVGLLAILKAGTMNDDARWRSMGLDPEKLRNDEEQAALKEWADRKAASKAARER